MAPFLLKQDFPYLQDENHPRPFQDIQRLGFFPRPDAVPNILQQINHSTASNPEHKC